MSSSRSEEMILKCIDRGLEVLGTNVKQTIYWHLESKFKVKKEEIPDKIDVFVNMLRKLFGSGARIIEEIIISEMVKEFGIKLKARSLEEAVRELRRKA